MPKTLVQVSRHGTMKTFLPEFHVTWKSAHFFRLRLPSPLSSARTNCPAQRVRLHLLTTFYHMEKFDPPSLHKVRRPIPPVLPTHIAPMARSCTTGTNRAHNHSSTLMQTLTPQKTWSHMLSNPWLPLSAQRSMFNVQHLQCLPPSACVSPSALPAPSTASPSTPGAFPHTPSRDDRDDRASVDPRVHPHTETEPCFPCAGSPIQVDPVTHPIYPAPPPLTLSPVNIDVPSSPSLPPFFTVLASALSLCSRVCSCSPFSSSFSCSVLLFLIFFHASSSPAFAASSPSHGLTSFSLYANGLYDVMKTNAIQDHVVSLAPHVWVINETRSCSSVASHVSVPSYSMYETPTVRSSPRSSKWVLIAAVRNGLHTDSSI